MSTHAKTKKRTSGSEFVEYPPRTCPHCGIEYIPRQCTQKTCAKKKCQVAQSIKMQNDKKEVVACEMCGVMFERVAKSKDSRKTCSAKCSALLRKKHTENTVRAKGKRHCSICGKSFVIEKFGQNECRSCTEKTDWVVYDGDPIDCLAFQTFITEFPSFDCPECDPMTNRMEPSVRVNIAREI